MNRNSVVISNIKTEFLNYFSTKMLINPRSMEYKEEGIDPAHPTI